MHYETNFRVGHPAVAHHPAPQKRATCPGGFHKAPKFGESYDSMKPLTVSWDPSCLSADAVDIWLYQPEGESSRIHNWINIPNSLGTYDAELLPRWWGSAPSTMLQISVVKTGQPPFLSEFPAGPIFTATYTPPADGSTPDAANVAKHASGEQTTVYGQPVMSGAAAQPKLSNGKIAAAVIMPLLIVAVAIFGYLKWTRAKGKVQRQQWTQSVDKRMSTISTDWKSMSAAGATAAIRASMAVDGEKRDSSFSFGAIRPSSTFATEGGQAGVGARSLYSQDNGSSPSMSQLRPGLRQSAFENRTSRISFAADTRPSGESRRTRRWDDNDAPPLPPAARGTSYFYDDEKAPAPEVDDFSPHQTAGALALSQEDIRTGGLSPRVDSTYDDSVLPALNYMRNGSSDDFISPPQPAYANPASKPPHSAASTHSAYSLPSAQPNGDYFGAASPDQYVNAPASATLFSASPASPNFPSSPPTAPTSFGGMMQPIMPANVMSPDDMLRAYAERSVANAMARRASSGSGVTGISTSTISAPMPATMPFEHSSNPSLGGGNRMSSYLGHGVGFGASVAPGMPPSASAGSNRRSLMPAGPGVTSPSRGVYGIAYEDEEYTQAR